MDAKTIKNISSLARIKLSAKNEEKMKEELSSILGYIEKLNSVNTDDVEPMRQTTGLVNVLRDDVGNRDGEPNGLGLVKRAPQAHNNFVKVRSILNKND